MPQNKITKAVKNKIDSLMEKKDLSVYNKLLTDYKNSNAKHQKLFDSLIDTTNKLEEKSSIKLLTQAYKEQEKITALLAKMEKFPEFKNDKASIQIDKKEREHKVNLYQHKAGEEKYKNILSQLQIMKKEVTEQTHLLNETEKNINKVSNNEIHNTAVLYQDQSDVLTAQLDQLRTEQKSLENKINSYKEEKKIQVVNSMKESYKPKSSDLSAIYGEIARVQQGTVEKVEAKNPHPERDSKEFNDAAKNFSKVASLTSKTTKPRVVISSQRKPESGRFEH